MTKDGSNAHKQAARQLAEAEQIPYTEALRRLEHQTNDTEFANPPSAAPYAPPAVRVGPPVPTLTDQTTLRGHTSRVCGAFLGPDGRTLVSGGDITARIWDLESAETTVCLYQHAGVTVA